MQLTKHCVRATIKRDRSASFALIFVRVRKARDEVGSDGIQRQGDADNLLVHARRKAEGHGSGVGNNDALRVHVDKPDLPQVGGAWYGGA